MVIFIRTKWKQFSTKWQKYRHIMSTQWLICVTLNASTSFSFNSKNSLSFDYFTLPSFWSVSISCCCRTGFCSEIISCFVMSIEIARLIFPLLFCFWFWWTRAWTDAQKICQLLLMCKGLWRFSGQNQGQFINEHYASDDRQKKKQNEQHKNHNEFHSIVRKSLQKTLFLALTRNISNS